MASSCKHTPQHCHDLAEDHQCSQPRSIHRRRCSNRFTSTSSRIMHFNNNSTWKTMSAVVIFVAVLFMPRNIKPTVEEQPHPADVNNDIFPTIEIRPEIKTLPEPIVTQSGIEPQDSSENLEENIRNSVKTEMELDQNLEPSPVQEILKDITEPEIRQAIAEDLNESIIVKKEKKLLPEIAAVEITENLENIKDQSQQEPSPVLEIVTKIAETDISQTLAGDLNEPIIGKNELELTPEITTVEIAEDIGKNKDQSQQEPEKPLEVYGDDLVFGPKLDESNVDIGITGGHQNVETQFNDKDKIETPDSLLPSSPDLSLAENLFESQINNTHLAVKEEKLEQDKPKDVMFDVQLVESTADIGGSRDARNLETQINNESKSENSDSSASSLSSESNSSESNTLESNSSENMRDLPIDEENEKEVEEDALSVLLDESSTISSDDKQILTNVEQSTLYFAQEVTTVIPEEFEHNVIKKVLDEKDIFEELLENPLPPPVDESVAGIELNQTLELDQTTVVAPIAILEQDLPKYSPTDTKSENQQENKEGQHEPLNNGEPMVVTTNANKFEADTNDTYEKNSIPEVFNNEDIKEEDVTYQNQSQTNTEHVKDEEFNNNNKESVLAVVQTISNGLHNELEYSKGEKSIAINVATTNPSTESAYELNNENSDSPSEESFADSHFTSTTGAAFNINSHYENGQFVAESVDSTSTIKGYRSVNRALIIDDTAATFFENYPPQDAGQTLNGNLADESKALPVSTDDGPNRSTIIIILSSGTAFMFIVISVTIFLISFQRQHGTLDIEMQERSCGKDNLDEEDAETFAKLLEVELPRSVAIALDETEECL